MVVVADGVKTQELLMQDVTTWLRTGFKVETAPLYYPSWEILPHEAKLPHADVISERLETLIALLNTSFRKTSPAPLLVTSLPALLQRTFLPQMLSTQTRMIKRGESLNPLDLIEWLEDREYEPEVQVNHKGEIALRGGIVDIFPLTSPWPVRLEFFGDELESLRYFDPVTQISRDPIEHVVLPPAGELGILKKQWATKVPGANPPEWGLLLDYLPDETLFVLCEPELLDLHAARYEEQIPKDDPFFVSWQTFQGKLQARGMVRVEAAQRPETFSLDSSAEPDTPALVLDSLEAFRPLESKLPEAQVAAAQRSEFFAQMHRWLRQGYAVHLFCNNDGERQRFQELWQELGFAGQTAEGEPALPAIDACIAPLSRGFICETARQVVVTDAEIFGRYKIQRPRRMKSPHAATTRSALDIDFSDLEEGDYVVHLQHGVGRYVGLKILEPSTPREGKPEPALNKKMGQECLVIEYAASRPDLPAPRLYVPVSEAHLVSKYVGAGKARPQMNVLGGARWAKTKAQAEVAVRDLAADLLSIQATRETQEGHSFPVDTPWQREFEGSFLYEETPDQARAIDEAKKDMENTKPMDRLICGDVGFGKTEVAIRTAFKAVMGGKQVAILVPTTVLAQQHYNSFRERMADYPVKVALLSRFRSRREQQVVIEQLAAGGVDIVIGTHRLVQSDIVFKDLGLVVIDEEQRFGVKHKEKLKQLRRLVDVLTLSATPIPRTLYLSLTGARDMSTIETPPQDRLPVETIVCQYDERVIRDAIQRELNREGQVFFLHNRVGDIESVALRLQALAPRARIVVGHGQMDADELEEVMTRFVNGEADVLVSTTIIESGMDIPNANTIIIDRADRFGLSDLYQLRGRVGRYKHQAYAYLLLPRHAMLLTDARKRISAIRQYSQLGSGFKIAMRDLEIRGAGNVLGSQQSGHITAVGFDLYCQLLKQSIGALKGEKFRPRIEVQTRLDFLALNPGEEVVSPASGKKRGAETPAPSTIIIPREVEYVYDETDLVEERSNVPEIRAAAYIPYDYIAESKLRVDAYRKLAQATESKTVAALRTELRDRFGALPEAVELLLQLQELTVLAADKKITVLETREDRLMLTRNQDYIMLDGRFPRLSKKTAKGRLSEIKRLLMAL
jgi:transcription-repair coupling factor (superfamily II helicase)